jgi:hypothetical protein
VWSVTSLEVEKDEGVRGRSRAVKDRWRWRLEGGAARCRLHRQPRVVAASNSADGEGGGAGKEEEWPKAKEGRRKAESGSGAVDGPAH